MAKNQVPDELISEEEADYRVRYLACMIRDLDKKLDTIIKAMANPLLTIDENGNISEIKAKDILDLI